MAELKGIFEMVSTLMQSKTPGSNIKASKIIANAALKNLVEAKTWAAETFPSTR